LAPPSPVVSRETDTRIAVCGRRREPLQSVAADTEGLALALDITNEAEAKRCVHETSAAFGRLDALVLNAGVVRAAPLADMTLSDWDATLQTNLTAAFLVARAAPPHLRRQGGAIVSVASVSALRAGPALGAYCASKAGLLLLTQTIALGHAAEGVRANAICPGWTRTSMADEEMDQLATELDIDREAACGRVTGLVPQRRPADADEVADVVAWLVSPASTYVTGAVLRSTGAARRWTSALLHSAGSDRCRAPRRFLSRSTLAPSSSTVSTYPSGRPRCSPPCSAVA
jgi:NAD(P)-dependent dehydrogenase (short-subunit alcohol dehydrogenase family)